jgi:hypothetical protein
MARRSDWADLELRNEMTHERIRRMGADIVRYVPALRAEFERARSLGCGDDAGFAGWYAQGAG